MPKAGVVGYPISHSLSPAIFDYFCKVTGKNLDYQKHSVAPEHLDLFLSSCAKDNDFLALNVTLPHKEKALRSSHEQSPEAVLVKAANVITFKDSKTKAHNTDVFGFTSSLSRHLSLSPQSQVLILGAGGAARAVTHALLKMGVVHIDFVNRSQERLKELIADFSQLFPKAQLNASAQESRGYDLLIQSTPLGMAGTQNINGLNFELILDKYSFSKNALAFDLIYNPLKTDFLKLAKQKGLRTLNGLEMLIDQALETWAIIHNERIDETHIYPQLLHDLEKILDLPETNPICLCGFMGSGKTTVAKALARKIGWKHIDTDQEIIKLEGLSIKEIFAQKGEDYFRDLETQIIKQSLQEKKSIISLGGGSLLRAINLEMLKAQSHLLFLELPMNLLLDRLKNEATERPLLSSVEPEAREAFIKNLYKLREAAYAQAPIRIAAAESPERLADKIIDRLSNGVQKSL